jgi:hypothetical protein
MNRFLSAASDYVLLILAAFIGGLVVVALLLWLNPDPDAVVNNGLPLVVVATGAAVVIFWFGAGMHSWFSNRMWRRVAVATFIVGAGVATCLWMNSLHLSYTSAEDMAGMMWVFIQAVAVLLILAALFVVRRAGLQRNWWSLRLRLVLAAVLVCGVIYLKRDEPVWPVVGRNEAALAGFNNDETTYLLTLRYSTGAGGGGREFKAPKNSLSFPSEKAKRRDYLLAHRAEIEANWAELAEVRAWWAEMAAQDSLGDRSTWDVDQSFIRFGPVRFYQQTALALAQLQALDGDGDGAMARVLEVYKVGANLERPACTMIRGMIAVVVQKEALRAADFILDYAVVSKEGRERFAEQVASSPEGNSRIGTMFLAEAMYASSNISNISRFAWRQPSDKWHNILFATIGAGFRCLAFNPQATVNRVHKRMAQTALLADARDLVKLSELDKNMNAEQLGGFQVKNIAGRMMIPMFSSAFEKIAKSYWEKEDLRAALVSRLQAQDGGN